MKKRKIKGINNAGLCSEPSFILFIKGANNSDHDCIKHLNLYVLIIC